MAETPSNENEKPVTGVNARMPPNSRSKSGIGYATRYDATQYQLNSLTYPSDLFGDRNGNKYGENYVVFYINVVDESVIVKNNTAALASVDSTSINSSLRGGVATADYSGATLTAGGALAGVGVSGLVEAGKSALSDKSGMTSKEISKAQSNTNKNILGVGALGAAPAAIVSAAAANTSRQVKRLKTSITLNVPNSLTTRYSVNYSEEDMAMQAALANTAADVGRALNVKQGGNLQNAGNAATGAGNAIAAAALRVPGGDFLSAATGLAPNPKKEQVFKGVDFRTFNFEYMFAPRNEKEEVTVREIIKQFKLHMHPEYKDANGYLFMYPSEFDIYYYQGMEENMNLPRHTSCVLVDMSVNYTPNGMFNTFDNGAATQIQVNLVFKELAILTKQQIMDGF